MLPLKLYFIDHYDSFSFNVVDWLRGTSKDIEIHHVQFDDRGAMQSIYDDLCPIVLSPGPRHPNDAEPTRNLVKDLIGKVPVLGICLGHQILGQIAGFKIVKAAAPFHGSTLEILPTVTTHLFQGMPASFAAATYNSLVVQTCNSVDPDWHIDAKDSLGGIQAISKKKAGEYPAFGLQFHPESFLTQYADILRSNWLHEVRDYYLPFPHSGKINGPMPIN